MSKMGLNDPFGYLKHKLWPKKRSRIAQIYLRACGVLHIIRKLLTRVTTLLQTSSLLKVCT
jgi:hypothetical protein